MSVATYKQCNQLLSKSYRILCGVCRWQHSSKKHDIADGSKDKPKPFSEIPEPKKLPLLGTFLDYTSFRKFDPKYVHKLIQNRHEVLGPIYKENMVPGLTKCLVYTSSASDVEKYFRMNERFPIRPPFEIVEATRKELGLNVGILNTKGEEWYRVRKVYNEHLMTNKSVWNYTKAHLEISHDLAEYIKKKLNEKNEVPELQNYLYHWGLECGAAFTLDTRLGTFTNEVTNLTQALIDSSYNMLQSWTKLIFSPPIYKYIKTKDYKDVLKYQTQQFEAIKEIAKTKTSDSSFQKLASESTLLTQSERDMVVPEILGAAVDTTSNAAAFLLYCLATNPDKQEILRKEIMELLNSGEEVTGKVLRRMRYMHAANMEAQRLFPLVFLMVREASEDMVMSGYQIPKGTSVLFTSNIMNGRDPQYFEDPDSFLPERWMQTETRSKLVMSGSFGIGSRKCPGRMFALQELSCLMIALLSRYKIEYHYKPFEMMIRVVNVPTEEPRFTFIPLHK